MPVRERLCVLLAALDILQGQGEALTIDRRAFYNQLYLTLLLVPQQVLYEGAGGTSSRRQQQQPDAETGSQEESEQELLQEASRAMQAARISQQGWEAVAGNTAGASAAATQPPPSASAGRRHGHHQQLQQPQADAPTSVLLLRCLEQQLLRVKQTDMARLAAFAKRLVGLMLSSSPSEALGAACLLWRLVQRYPKLVSLFEWDGGAPVGGQQYVPDCGDPSEAGALAAALWELPLAAQHYHPHVAAAARALLGLTPGSQAAAAAADGDSDGAQPGGGGKGAAAAAAGLIAGAAGPQQLAAMYEAVRRGGFRPPPTTPNAAPGVGKGRGVVAGGSASSRAGMAARVAAAGRPWSAELTQAALEQQAGAGAVAGQPGAKQAQQQQPNKRQKHAPGKAATPPAAAAAADGGDDDEAGMADVQGAVLLHYRLSRQHRRNQALRRELAVTFKKLQLFREHLIQRRQQQVQQQVVQQKQQQKA
jgi:hypothetical protein